MPLDKGNARRYYLIGLEETAMASIEEDVKFLEKADVKVAKERSPSYPAIDVGEAVRLTNLLWSQAKRTNVSYTVAAQSMGFEKVTGAVGTKLAALKKYGLAEGQGSNIRVSPLGVQLVQYPEGSPEYAAAMKEAALKPNIFKELLRDYLDVADQVLRPDLVTKKRFSEAGADQVIRAFRDTVKVAQLSESDYIPPETEDQGEDMATDTVVRRQDALPPSGAGVRIPSPAGEVERMRVALKGGRSARILFSGEMPTQEDIAKVVAALNLQKDSFPEN